MPRGTSAASQPTATKGTPPAPTGPGSKASTHRPHAYTSYMGEKVAQHFETGWGVGVVCCIAADPRLKSRTRTPALDALRPTKSQPFSIIWEDNTDSMVDLCTLLQIVRNYEQGLHKPSTSIPPPTSNGASAQSSVVSQDLRGLERHYWKGTEAGCLGCYDFSGETWAGDGSMHKGVMVSAFKDRRAI
jgi:hypothetical protein